MPSYLLLLVVWKEKKKVQCNLGMVTGNLLNCFGSSCYPRNDRLTSWSCRNPERSSEIRSEIEKLLKKWMRLKNLADIKEINFCRKLYPWLMTGQKMKTRSGCWKLLWLKMGCTQLQSIHEKYIKNCCFWKMGIEVSFQHQKYWVLRFILMSTRRR